MKLRLLAILILAMLQTACLNNDADNVEFLAKQGYTSVTITETADPRCGSLKRYWEAKHANQTVTGCTQ